VRSPAGTGALAQWFCCVGRITVGPAVFGGFVLAGEGEKALSKAREYEAQVNVAIAKIDA
jgi:hypothetical protein